MATRKEFEDFIIVVYIKISTCKSYSNSNYNFCLYFWKMCQANMVYLYFMSVLCAMTNAGNVLLLTPFGSPSHKNLFTPTAYGLAEKGHSVTLVSIYKPKESSPNVKEVVMENLIPTSKELVYWLCKEGIDGPTVEVLNGYISTAKKMCETFFMNDLVQSWVKRKEKFDIVIVDGVLHDCLFPVANLMGKKVGALNTAALFSWIADSIDSPYPYSIIPFYLFPFKARMNFWERMINAFSFSKYDHEMQSAYYPAMEEIVRKYYPQAITISESMKNLSLVLCNGEPLLGTIRPSVPTVKYMGGIHCRPGQAVEK
uniref:Glucuronosyltransferase n=1 Tax=Strigamia maritima TaxID=126957 RepID=T1JLQ6_STRMM